MSQGRLLKISTSCQFSVFYLLATMIFTPLLRAYDNHYKNVETMCICFYVHVLGHLCGRN